MQISNISDLARLSDYRIKATEGYNALAGTPRGKVDCIVRGHDRAQSVWALVAKASHEIVEAGA
jgi:hypothetical protein